MDVVGTVASIIQLLNNAIVAFQKVKDLPSRVREQGKILTELVCIAHEVRTNSSLQIEPIEQLLQELLEKVENLQTKLPPSVPKTGKFANYWKSIKYTFREADVLSSIASLEPTKTSLLICITTEQMKYAGRSLSYTEDIRAKVNRIHNKLLEDDAAAIDTQDVFDDTNTETAASTRSASWSPNSRADAISYSWNGQRATDNARQFNGNRGFESFFGSNMHFTDIESSGSSHQMNGSITRGLYPQESGWKPRKVVYTGITARGNSFQFNGDVCDPEGSVRWPL